MKIRKLINFHFWFQILDRGGKTEEIMNYTNFGIRFSVYNYIWNCKIETNQVFNAGSSVKITGNRYKQRRLVFEHKEILYHVLPKDLNTK